MATDTAWIDRVKAMGYSMIAVGTDVGLLADATQRMVGYASSER
jgi:2-keto-3-deoxy-L-rhamnonate aldolase RhmA